MSSDEIEQQSRTRLQRFLFGTHGKWKPGAAARDLLGLAVVGLIVYGFWSAPRSPQAPKTAATHTESTAAAQTRTASLIITSEGLKQRKIPHNPDSPFYDTHEIELRTIKRSDAGMDWLPAEEVEVGCVPCFNALTAIAIVDGKAYALNGATRVRAKQMTVKSGTQTLKVNDPYEGPGAAPEPMMPKLVQLIDQVWATPGCAMDQTVKGSLDRTVAALQEGVCLPSGD